MQCMTNAISTGGGSWTPDPVLENNSWDDIKRTSDEGIASSVFAVGDTKSVDLSGTVGTISINLNLLVYIIGFDHNEPLQGKGITFEGFKDIEGIDVVLFDDTFVYPDYVTDGSKRFNYNHRSNSTYGGWKRCDCRYDILGSTNVSPQGYGNAPSAGQVGYDATDDCATNPVANTLLAAFPEGLRKVMKPMTVYTDNVSGSDSAGNVTASKDFLPLLSEFEVFGERKSANSYEKNYQQQYDYYKKGNPKIKYMHNKKTLATIYQLRSVEPARLGACRVNPDGTANSDYGSRPSGLSPIFLI